jgi:predicted Fe-S protein YdhL (DUF1289 family)
MASFLQLEPDTIFDSLLVQQRTHEFYILLEDNTPVADQVEIVLPKTKFLEESTFTLTAYFRTRGTKTASTPTTIRYRVDCLKTKQEVLDWTSVSPAANVSIVISAANNQIRDNSNRFERKQIIVQADNGLTTQVNGKSVWQVKNLTGIT